MPNSNEYKAAKDAVVSIEINGIKHTRLVRANMSLLEFVRDELDLTGTKKGCDEGECGCCTVLVDEMPVLACLGLAAEFEGKKIMTIEGLANGSTLHPVQKAFIEHGATQCGYCSPSMILNGAALLERNATPSETEINECVSGTICRCTGYTKIKEAIRAAAEDISAEGAK